MKVPELKSPVEKRTRRVTRVVTLTRADIQAWIIDPEIQREFTTTKKVREMSETIKATGAIPGVIIIGIFQGKEYNLDSQHRCGAFLNNVEEGCEDAVDATVLWEYHDSYAALAKRFHDAQQVVKRPRPDDSLRPLQHSLPALKHIVVECPYVGFGPVQRCNRSSLKVVSMSVLLKCWMGSVSETPATSSGSARDIANSMTMQDSKDLIVFLKLAHKAWGRTPEHHRLWGAINLTLCMWLYRRMVLNPELGVTALTPKQFGDCLATLPNEITNSDYLEFLRSKKLDNRLRKVAIFQHIGPRFVSRIREEKIRGASRPKLPMAVWME